MGKFEVAGQLVEIDPSGEKTPILVNESDAAELLGHPKCREFTIRTKRRIC